MDDIEIKPVTNAAEFAEVSQLIAEVFARGSHEAYQRSMLYEGQRLKQPGFRYEDHYALRVAGRVVSNVYLSTHRLRYGSVTLNVAGVGAVCTQLRYQGKGYSAALMRACMEAIQQRDVALALLNGIPDYYHRFGFTPVIPGYTIEIAVQQAASLPQVYKSRPAQAKDLPVMQALYEQQWLAQRPTLLRTEAQWHWRWLENPPHFAQVIVNAADEVRGYVGGRGATAPITEVVAADADAARTILAEAAQRFATRGEQTIRWCVPPDAVFIDYARQSVDVQVQAHYFRNQGWMAHLPDADKLLAALLPEFQRRAGPDVYATRSATGVRIGSQLDDSVACDLSQHDFLQLLFGSLAPRTLQTSPEMQVILRALFTGSPAMLAPLDWF